MLTYYTYVSDSKIDMLFQQVPERFLRRATAELRLDIKLISISLKREPSEYNRYNRLRIVLDYIHREGSPGALADYPPRSWLFDEILMTTVQVGDSCILYVGSSGRTSVCLIGSVASIIGFRPRQAEAPEATWPMIQALLANVDKVPLSVIPRMNPEANVGSADFAATERKLDFQVIDQALEGTVGIPRRMRFAARKVAWKEMPLTRSISILATPVCVSESDL